MTIFNANHRKSYDSVASRSSLIIRNSLIQPKLTQSAFMLAHSGISIPAHPSSVPATRTDAEYRYSLASLQSALRKNKSRASIVLQMDDDEFGSEDDLEVPSAPGPAFTTRRSSRSAFPRPSGYLVNLTEEDIRLASLSLPPTQTHAAGGAYGGMASSSRDPRLQAAEKRTTGKANGDGHLAYSEVGWEKKGVKSPAKRKTAAISLSVSMKKRMGLEVVSESGGCSGISDLSL